MLAAAWKDTHGLAAERRVKQPTATIVDRKLFGVGGAVKKRAGIKPGPQADSYWRRGVACMTFGRNTLVVWDYAGRGVDCGRVLYQNSRKWWVRIGSMIFSLERANAAT